MRQATITPPIEELTELRTGIFKLKAELKAVILSHNYQRPEVQDIADFVGDSLELSRQATKVDAAVIIFCGVHFMAETAAVLNPDKKVMLAAGTAGCPMADMIDEIELQKWKKQYPDAAVVCYVNTTAAVKAESDICCTSANAVRVVESVPNKKVIFIPDKNLGNFVGTKTRKELILYPGYCITHIRLKPEQVRLAKKLHPEAKVVVHPECTPEVVSIADAVCSTSQMIRYVRESDAKEFLIGTEEGLLYRMRRENPEKEFYLIAPGLTCPNMKKTTLKSIVETMEKQRNIIHVEEDIRLRAKSAIDRMLNIP